MHLKFYFNHFITNLLIQYYRFVRFFKGFINFLKFNYQNLAFKKFLLFPIFIKNLGYLFNPHPKSFPFLN